MKNLVDGEIFFGGAENRRATFRPPEPGKLGVIRNNDGRYGCACHASRRDRSASHTSGHHEWNLLLDNARRKNPRVDAVRTIISTILR